MMGPSHDQIMKLICLMADATVRRSSPPERTKLRRDTSCVAAPFSRRVPSLWIDRRSCQPSAAPDKTVGAPLLAADTVMNEE